MRKWLSWCAIDRLAPSCCCAHSILTRRADALCPRQIPQFKEFLRFADHTYSEDLDTEGSPPEPTVGTVEDDFRSGDEVEQSSDDVLATILRNMPEEERGFLRVPRVVEDDAQ